jgi:fatty acid desaturase
MAIPNPVAWYRTPVPAKEFKELHERSDLLGALQSGGYLALITIAGAAAMVSVHRLPFWAVALLVLAYGTVCSFLPNGVHELCHGTVFRTPALNALFLRVFSFLGWHNFEFFWASHQRHHRYTLHPPDDLEVVLPMHLFVRNLLLQGIVDPLGAWNTIARTCRIASGRMEGAWELALYPDGQPEARRPVVRWARVLIAGHVLILAVSAYLHLWLLPVLTSLAPFYGSWLFLLCNNSQHMGLAGNVEDFRLCCRTITLNPLLQFLYWHMNYHTEHHMYAAVPCYRLGRLHRLIRHDLPPCPRGLVATWTEIAAIQRRQLAEPSYRYVAPLPSSPATPRIQPQPGQT